jgi:hypothetical protein
MGVVIETCIKYPGGPTRMKGTGILWCAAGIICNMQRPWPFVKGNGFILVSEYLPGFISVSSKVVKYINTKGPKPDLSHCRAVCRCRCREVGLLPASCIRNGQHSCFVYYEDLRFR